MNDLQLYYDNEGDYLELQVGRYSKGHFRNLGNGIFERVDEKTNKVTGIGVLGFKKRTKDQDLRLSLPFSLNIKKEEAIEQK
ncbi:MAG: hypothetical protein KKG59_04000 [Nanoarchaeota archaeon]|nr:hypothetical protein [Nanoarchaeota archaeon]